MVSNNMGVDGKGLGALLENGQVRRVISSYVGKNKGFAAAYLAGTLEVEFALQISAHGDLANWMVPGAMDLVAGIPHVNLITDLAVFDVTDAGLVLRELAPGVTMEEAREKTGATFVTGRREDTTAAPGALY